MNRIFILFAFSIIQCISSHAQNSIRGRITDSETNEPIFGASIYVADLKTGGATDTNGVFIIRNVPPGNFLAEIRMLTYASQAIMLAAKPDDQWTNENIPNIRLVKTPAEYHPVIITGVSGSTDRLRNPVPSTLQTRDHMLQHSSTNAVNALTELPGISSVSTGSAISKPVIRGLGYNRVVVLRNNVRQEGQQWGDEHGIEIDEFEIDRVEIIKGPGSIMYGSDAMAGVINFMTPRPVSDGVIGGEFISGYQTNGQLFGNSLMQSGNIKGISWQYRITQKIAGNYSTPADGYVANTGFRELNMSGFIGLNRHWGVSQISFSTFNQLVGLPEGERDSLGNFIVPVALNDSTEGYQSFTSDQLHGYRHHLDIPRQKIQHHRVVLSNDFFFNHSRLKLDIGFQQNNRFEFGNVLNPEEEEIAMRLNTINANATYFFTEKNNSQLTIGVNTQHQSNRNTGAEYIIPDYVTNDAGAFVHYRKIAGKWFIAAGARTDFRNLVSEALYLDSNEVPADSSEFTETKFASVQRNFFSFSGIAGVSYQPAEPIVIRLNVSRGFRVPNLAELSSNGRHEGTFRYETGSATLKPEYSLQFDAGMTYTSDHLNIEVSAFYNDIQGFIYLSKLGSVFGGDSIADPADPAPVYTFMQGHASLFGGEIFTDLHPHPFDWLHFENSFSFVQGSLLNQPDSMSNLPFVPPAKYQSEINAHSEKKIGPFRNAYASISIAVFFAQDRFYSAYGTETFTPSYYLLDAGFGTEVANKKDKVVFKLFFSANNLLNTKYQSHLSRLKYAPENPANGLRGIYGQGRNFSVRMVIPFQFTK